MVSNSHGVKPLVSIPKRNYTFWIYYIYRLIQLKTNQLQTDIDSFWK